MVGIKISYSSELISLILFNIDFSVPLKNGSIFLYILVEDKIKSIEFWSWINA